METNIAARFNETHLQAAGIFSADLARVLLSASKNDFALIRWIAPPPAADDFIRELHQLGERLILVD